MARTYAQRTEDNAKLAKQIAGQQETMFAAENLGFPQFTAINGAVRPILAAYAAQIVARYLGEDEVARLAEQIVGSTS